MNNTSEIMKKKKRYLMMRLIIQFLQKNYKTIQPDLDHNFTSPTMNSGLIDVYQNDLDNCIYDP